MRPVLPSAPGAVSLQRLLVSVRGPNEAVAAAKGSAHIADVEYPASALGIPYPLNIKTVREGTRFGSVKPELVDELLGDNE